MTTRKTFRNKSIDIDAIMIANETTIAVGNTRTNARGDELDSNGNIIKRASEKAKEYYQEPPKVTKNVSIKEDVVEEKIEQPAVQPKKRKERELPDGSIQVDE